MNNQTMNTNLEQLTKELRMTRIFCMASSALTLILLVGGIVLFGQLKPVFTWMEQTQPVLEELADSVSRLDVDAINEAVEGLDTEELSEAIENLNNTIDVLKGFGEKISSFKEKFNN